MTCVADRDGDSLVVGHVGDVRRRSSEVGRDDLLEDDVARRVQVDGRVVRLRSRLVGVVQQQVDHHVLPTFNRIIIIVIISRSVVTHQLATRRYDEQLSNLLEEPHC